MISGHTFRGVDGLAGGAVQQGGLGHVRGGEEGPHFVQGGAFGERGRPPDLHCTQAEKVLQGRDSGAQCCSGDGEEMWWDQPHKNILGSPPIFFRMHSGGGGAQWN